MAKKSTQKKTAKRASASGKAAGKTTGKASGAKPAPRKDAKPSKSAAVAKKSTLSKAELKELRDMLLEKRRDIVGDMSGIQREVFKGRQGGSNLSTMPLHLADLGSDNFEHEFSLGLLESERQLLKEIDEALERMQAGTYGICQGTGEPIAIARLRARPWAKYCIEYARLLEKGLVRTPDEPASADDEEDEDVEEDEAHGEELEGEVEVIGDDEE